MKKQPVHDGETTTCDPDGPAFRLEGRLRIWETNHCFKCPVVGMCLTFAEQKQLLKKTGLLEKKNSAYDIHEKLVAGLESENRLSRRMDNLLDHKYGKQAESLLALDANAFTTHFKVAMEKGEGACALWAAGIHPHLSPESNREIFGEIHMAMHWTAGERLKLSRKLARRERELNGLRQRVKAQSRQRRSMENEIEAYRQGRQRLENELVTAQREKTHLQRALAELDRHQQVEALEMENRRVQQDYASLSIRLEKVLCQTAALEKQNSCLSLQLEEQCNLNRHVKEQTQAIIGEMANWNPCDASCPSFDLCKKRILIVGGITRMESLYRELIESRGGVFEYHDGYVKKGAKSLESSLRRADMVLCPVNCNSHAACSIVKNLGKKHNKAVHILANSSLSTVSQVIWGKACNDACTLN
ncbi:DUF2325 domain-containing protein [uncultured Desulfosarcina sp.]|uniref:DUF2325 domain-containing protein n=1 Tax=uncultured Desulfosarcina sp. TaxID=218289 RepID=UPI0029C7D1A4|nr:DUF2325 domain-containing protein [uncultured Desulfosarcina sp.]